MKFQFRKCEREELPGIVEELYKKVPQSLPTLSLLQTCINYPSIKKNVFVPEDSLYNSLIVVTDVYYKWVFPSINVYWDPAILSDEELRSFLKNVPEWNWKQEFMLHCIIEPLCQKMMEILSEESFFGESLRLVSEPGSLLTLSEKNIKNFSLPIGYKFGKLLPHHVPYLLSTWGLSFLQDPEQLKKNIESLPSVTIFKEKDDIWTSNPVSFMILHEYGHAGMLYTSERHKRKGLAAVSETELAKKLFQNGQIMCVYVEDLNDISCNIHAKLGFVQVAEAGFYSALKDNRAIKMKK